MKNKNIVIDVRHLKKQFGQHVAVKDFSLQVTQGEICGFLGPNGSGKTTTLRMMCGLMVPTAGSGTCLGYDILTQSYEIKKQVGYMTQSFSLYQDLTAYENLDFIARTYGIPDRKIQIEQALKNYNLLDKRNQLVSALSGGWKQRLALAGCLLHHPKLLLLDEPTAGVDPKARRDFWDDIYALSKQGITTLVSTHYMDEAERCTKLIYISYGDLLAEGSISQIIQKAHLTTWVVSGDNLAPLEEKLKNKPGVDQVVFFGNKLHVSGKNETQLEYAIAPYKNKNWQHMPSTLEDAFISLVDSTAHPLNQPFTPHTHPPKGDQ
ncbi:MAG: ABC transporter ATP-binding protein [Gammaproteobacteria bacterium]|nr:ABC transporter ATP-binding protein [Gammaproteobacteria bacterium]